MQQLDRHSFTGGLNHDNAALNYPTSDYKALINARIVGNKEYASLQAINNSLEIPYTKPLGRNTFIGGVEDVDHSYAFVFNDAGNHHVLRIGQDNSVEIIYQNSLLNFNRDMWIQAAVFGDHLYFTDDVNEPKYINISSALNGEYSLDITEIYLLHRGPLYRLQVNKTNTGNNDTIKLANNAYQFAYRYKYKNGQVSVLSPWSDIVTYSYPLDFGGNLGIDEISVGIPSVEDIPEFVDEIEFMYKELDNPTWTTFETRYKTELTTNIVFKGQIGLSISDGEALRLYDNVPLKARALTGLKSRLFLGNIVQPKADNIRPTSLNISSSITDINTIDNSSTGAYHRFTLSRELSLLREADPDDIAFERVNLITRTVILYQGSYYLTIPNYYDANIALLPDSVIIDSTPYTAQEVYDLLHEEMDDWQDNFLESQNSSSQITSLDSVLNYETTDDLLKSALLSNAPTRVYASASNYQLAVAYYDAQGRIGKVITDDDWVHTTEERTWGIGTNGVDNVTTQIIAAPYGNTESIPEWATHYNVLRTRNLTTRYQVHGWSLKSRYVEVNNEDGSYNFVSTYDGNSVRYFGLSVSWLNEQGVGLTYNTGDILHISMKKSQAQGYVIEKHSLVAVGIVQGGYVFFEPKDIGDIDGQSLFFVYEQPYSNAVDEIFYEVVDRKPIINARRPNRRYSTEAFRIDGDVYAVFEGDTIAAKNIDGGVNVYALKASVHPRIHSYHDVVGRSVAIIDSGEHILPNTIVFSGQYFVNGEVNGLNTFFAFDSSEVDPDCGGIQSLQNTSKLEGLGSVMLTICRRKVFSIYIGEAQLNYSSNEAGLAITSNVIGSINDLSSGYGCDNRESICNYDGKIAWVDTRHGAVISYSRAGLTPLSDRMMSNHFRELLTSLHGTDARIYMGYLPNTMELFLTLNYEKTYDVDSLVLSDSNEVTATIERLDTSAVDTPVDYTAGTGLNEAVMADHLVELPSDILTDTSATGLTLPSDNGGDDDVVIDYIGVTPDPNDNPDTGDGGGQVGGGDNGGTTNWYDDYTWIVLASNYSVVPFITDTNSQGDIYQYEYESGNIAYRLVPDPYSANMDCFFLNYDSGTQVLSTEIACKTDSVTTI